MIRLRYKQNTEKNKCLQAHGRHTLLLISANWLLKSILMYHLQRIRWIRYLQNWHRHHWVTKLVHLPKEFLGAWELEMETRLLHGCKLRDSSFRLDVPKFRCLPSALLISLKPWRGSWWMRRVSSWLAMLLPGTTIYMNVAFCMPSFDRWARTRPARSSVCTKVNAHVKQNCFWCQTKIFSEKQGKK